MFYILFLLQNIQTVYSGQKPLLPFAESDVFDGNISHWRRLTANSADCKAVYEITLDIVVCLYNI